MNKLAWLLATPLLMSNVIAADLMQVYRDAVENDPTFSAARSALAAGREKIPQARAGLLPTVNLSGNSVWNENEINTGSPNSLSSNFNSNAYNISLTQPLFRWQNWVAYDQSKIQVALAEANFAQARQDLILRVAQAYFDVIYAGENLRAVQANKSAIAQQLAAAQKNFEVGTATITDTHEAQARFDLATAQEIAAQSELEIRQRNLQTIVGKEPGTLAPPRKDASLNPPQPADMKQWVAAAEQGSIAVQVQQANADIADREVSRQRGGHYPTVDLVANLGENNSLSASGISFTKINTEFQNVGVQLNIPIFQGGLVVSRQREASANRATAASALEGAKRNAALAASQYYLGVVNGLAQVRALKAAMLSSQSALESNKLGYEVGVRINIDVLNAENQLYVTRRDFAKSVLDTLMAQFRLKAAVGALSEDDVLAVNALLDPSRAL